MITGRISVDNKEEAIIVIQSFMEAWDIDSSELDY